MASEATGEVRESLRLIEDLKFFLATAPANWQDNQVIRRYYLNSDEGFVLCVYWNNLFFITGTDIVRCIVYKFEHFGRKIIDRKKFEEGIFSDLRNLKCGTDAILEPPRLEFLEFLFKNLCLRTQKKQKVFFWFNVPHDKLMADALERDLKKEKIGQNPTTIAHKEPALSFEYDENSALFSQLHDHIEAQRQPGDDGHKLPEYRRPEEPARGVDDFPLDYIDNPAPPPTAYPPPTSDGGELGVINLDPNHQLAYGNLLDDNYEGFVDTQMFVQLAPTAAAQQLVYTDEYLIEQAQPLKTPIPGMMPPRLARFGQFPRPPVPEEHPYPPQFVRPLNTPLQMFFAPPPNQYYGQPYYPVHEAAYAHEPEPWPPGYGPAPESGYPPYGVVEVDYQGAGYPMQPQPPYGYPPIARGGHPYKKRAVQHPPPRPANAQLPSDRKQVPVLNRSYNLDDIINSTTKVTPKIENPP